jgi:adenylate kinase
VLIVLLFGPPGCGKGTQAAYLAERFHIPAISTGEVLRAECKAGTPLGRLACGIMAKGGLVSDEIVNDVVARRIARQDCAGGFLLDGYPRTLTQARSFGRLLRERGLPEPVVVHLDVADHLLVARLTARRQCPKCLRIYNLLSQPPVADGICDDDRAALLTRDDDRETVIRERLKAYRSLTGPILDWYGAKRVFRVDGGGTAASVGWAIEKVLRNGTPEAITVE